MPSKQPRILLVEDDPNISSAVLMLLKHYGYEPTLASSLARGKAMMEPQQDLIVLDLMLPDGNGIDILQEVRMTGSKTRVIVLTGSTDAALERRIRRLTPNQLFHKPLNFLELLDGIRLELPASAHAA